MRGAEAEWPGGSYRCLPAFLDEWMDSCLALSCPHGHIHHGESRESLYLIHCTGCVVKGDKEGGFNVCTAKAHLRGV